MLLSRRSFNRDEAKRIWLRSSKQKLLKDIAKELGVSEGLVRKWKCQDKWDEDDSWPEITSSGNSNIAVGKGNDSNGNRNNTPIEINETHVNKEVLNERELLFCIGYLKNFNATTAVINAGYNPGNRQRASEMGYQLLQRPTVRAEIERLKRIKRESIMLSPDDIVELQMRIAFSSVTDFADFGTKEKIIGISDDGELIKTQATYLEFHDHNNVDGNLISEIKVNNHGMSIKLEDRQKALQWLSDFFNMNPMHKHKQWYDEQKLKLHKEELELRKEIEANKNW